MPFSAKTNLEPTDADRISTDSDPNCGGAFDAAVDDTSLGLVHGCSQTNPENPVVVPTTTPTCG